MPKEVYAFGSNRAGQLGCAFADDSGTSPQLNPALQYVDCNSVCLSSAQSYIVSADGVLWNCGENDENELGRSGKRSVFNRVDALEAFSLVDIAAGKGFVVAACVDGRLMAWGRNDLGQLGNGSRESRLKPRFNTGLSHRVLQVVAGAEHVVALSHTGSVLTWGGNRKGQLGDGQFTSRNTPGEVAELRHRPICSIACGDAHSMALTVGGTIYTWGENSQGQLGLGDCKNRLRPEVMRSLKAAHCVKIAAGGHHSMAISHPLGLLFGFGSNSHGQLGQGQSGDGTDCPDSAHVRVFTSPTVVDALRDMQVIDVACGWGHTLVVCRGRLEESYGEADLRRESVYAMGLSSCGQCGLGHYHDVYRPVRLSISSGDEDASALSGGYCSYSVHTGPLAHHSVVCRSISPIVDEPLAYTHRQSLPVVNCEALEKAVDMWVRTASPSTLTSLRDMVAECFASVAVLNSSFRPLRRARDSGNASSRSTLRAGIDLDLHAVRRAYSILCSTNNEKVLSTLGRATLLVTEQLKECIFDSGENMSVFLIVLENPLLLRPDKFHVALQRLVSGILAIPKTFRLMFFGWLKHFPSEYFSRIVQVMQGFLSFVLTNRASDLNPTPVVLVLDSLFACNNEAKIIPQSLFYNESIAKSLNIYREWEKFVTSDVSKVFNFFSYPFLLPSEAKNDIVRANFSHQKVRQESRHAMKYLRSHDGKLLDMPSMPRGMALVPTSGQQLSVILQIRVHRESVLDDLMENLKGVLTDDPNTLLLPLSVVFEGEQGIDEGGVARELFAVAIREFLSSRRALRPCGDHDEQLWFTRVSSLSSTGTTEEEFSEEYLLGVIVGLACYNGILVNLPIVPVVYKLWTGGKPELEDLWGVDTHMARAMQMMLEFDADNSSYAETFGVTFVASANPIVKSINTTDNAAPNASVELVPNGNDIYVTNSNRKEFVEKFISHALYDCCREAVEDFLGGLRLTLHSRALDICTQNEIEHIVCGMSDIGNLTLLRPHATYLGEFHDQHPVIKYFWEALGKLSVPYQKRFLIFVTATDRVPIGGLEKIGLTIQSTSQPASALPAAHTCFNILDLPSSYISTQQLYDRLLLSLEHFLGFGLA